MEEYAVEYHNDKNLKFSDKLSIRFNRILNCLSNSLGSKI